MAVRGVPPHAAPTHPIPKSRPAQKRHDPADTTGANRGVTFSGQGQSKRPALRAPSVGADQIVSGKRSDSPFHAPPTACSSVGKTSQSAKKPAAKTPHAATSANRRPLSRGNASGQSPINTASSSGSTSAVSLASNASAPNASPPASPNTKRSRARAKACNPASISSRQSTSARNPGACTASTPAGCSANSSPAASASQSSAPRRRNSPTHNPAQPKCNSRLVTRQPAGRNPYSARSAKYVASTAGRRPFTTDGSFSVRPVTTCVQLAESAR